MVFYGSKIIILGFWTVGQINKQHEYVTYGSGKL